MQVKFKKLHKNAIIPQYQHKGDSCFDFHAVLDEDAMIIAPGQRALIKTGLAVEMPEGYELQIRARSGLAIKNGIMLVNGIGTVDSSYRGEIGVVVYNSGSCPFIIMNGIRIAQGAICQLPSVEILEVAEVNETQRRQGGFGSTGV